MICIQKELNQMGLRQDNAEKLSPHTDNLFGNRCDDDDDDINNEDHATDSSVDHTCPNAFGSAAGKPIGLFDNILGCMRPFLSLIDKSAVIEKNNKSEQWEIPFESISDLEWLGSGAQGTVFSGKLKNEIVAVKKVRDLKETDIKHLRKLDHENIIKFK